MPWAATATATAALLLHLMAPTAAAVALPNPRITKEDYAALADGVGTLETSGYESSAHHLSGPALAVAALANDGAAVVSASKLMDGRVVAFGHEDMLEDCWGDDGLGRLVRNAAAWAAGDKTEGVRVAGGSDAVTESTVEALEEQDSGHFENVGTVRPARLSRANVDVYVLNAQDQAVGRYAKLIRAFIAAGGGLLVGAQVADWAYTAPVKQHPANMLLMTLGIAMAAGYVEGDAVVDPIQPPLQLGRAEVAASCIRASCLGDTYSPCYIASDDVLTGAMEGLAAHAAFIPRSEPEGAFFWAQMDEWEAGAKTSKTGINNEAPIKRRSAEGLGALARTIKYLHLPPEQLPINPDAKFFPGLPPSGAQPTSAPVVMTVNGNTPERYWQCLGAYAMPGRPVTVRLPSSVVAAGGATLQIGGWTDRLYHKTDWVRLPEIVRQYKVQAESTVIGSASGGLIYLILREGSKLGSLRTEVSGALSAPLFLAGTTNPDTWAVQLLSSAPWGEVGSSKLAIASPIDALRNVSDPTAVTGFWDKVMDSHAWLAAIPAERPAPMRIQHDIDIADGYLHSGYPIMTFMDLPVSLLTVQEDQWGLLHELGHNHQEEAWNWDCAWEVTCDLFAARAGLAVCNHSDPDNFYGFLGMEGSRRARRAAYFAEGPSHDRLCGDEELYLDSFMQLVDEGGFGFELIRDTFASYRQLSEEQIPHDNNAKIQTWIKQQSLVARRNFAPYYRAWGWPVDEETEAALADLPPYPEQSAVAG